MTSIVEVIFMPIKEGVDAASELAEATVALSQQPGFLHLYHGPLVEDRTIHCLVFQWRERASVEAWGRNPLAYVMRDKLVDSALNKEAGLEPFVTFALFKHDITASITANVTEIAYFSLPDKHATEQVVMEKLIGDADVTQHPVITVGKAKGGAMGHVYLVRPEMAEVENTTAFTGLFGYDNIDDHWKWRESPVHAEVIKGMQALSDELGLKAVDVLGKRRAMIAGTGIVHVEFKKLCSGSL